MNKQKSLLARVVLVLFLLTKLSIPLLAGAEELTFANKPAVNYAEVGNERTVSPLLNARASIKFVSKDKILIDIIENEKLGEVLISRNSDINNQIIAVSFATNDGNALSIKTANDAYGNQHTTISYNNLAVKLKSSEVKSGIINSLQQAKLETIFSNIKSNRSLSKLTVAAVPLLNVNSLLNESSPGSDHYYVTDCAVEATDCLVALVAYGMSMGALVSSCGFSFGAGCVAALLAHPILGGAVAIYCGRAIESCGLNR